MCLCPGFPLRKLEVIWHILRISLIKSHYILIERHIVHRYTTHTVRVEDGRMRISQKITNVIKRGMRPVDCRYIAAIALWRLVEISWLAPIEYPPELLIGVLSLWLIETFDEGALPSIPVSTTSSCAIHSSAGSIPATSVGNGNRSATSGCTTSTVSRRCIQLSARGSRLVSHGGCDASPPTSLYR